MEESEDDSDSDEPLSASTSGLFLLFPVLLEFSVNAECLHDHIFFSFKAQAKKKKDGQKKS